MPSPSINSKYYSTLLSASQNIPRCISFSPSTPITLSNYFGEIEVVSNPIPGHSFSVEGKVYTFVSGTPTIDTEIQILGTREDTASNLKNALNGSSQFPVYLYDFQFTGTRFVSWSSRVAGEKFNKNIDTLLAPSIVYTEVQAGQDYQFQEGYKLVVEVLVGGEYIGTATIEPKVSYDIINGFSNSLLLDLNTILKDSVYAEDPVLNYNPVVRDSTVSREVELLAYEVYSGYDGYESGESISSSDGWIINSRGIPVDLNNIQNDEDYNNLADDFYPSVSNLPVRAFIEHPSIEREYEICEGDPFYVNWFIPDSYGSGVGNELQLIMPNSSVVPVPISSFYTVEGVYRIDLASLSRSFSAGAGDSFKARLVYDPSGGTQADIEKIAFTETVTININDECGDLCQCHNTFIFLNQWGVYEQFITTCDTKVAHDFSQDIAEQCIDCSDREVSMLVYNQNQSTGRVSNISRSELRTVFKTIPNSQEYLDYVKSFLYSSKVFVLNENKDAYTPCKINTKTRSISTGKSNITIRIQYEKFPRRVSTSR